MGMGRALIPSAIAISALAACGLDLGGSATFVNGGDEGGSDTVTDATSGTQDARGVTPGGDASPIADAPDDAPIPPDALDAGASTPSFRCGDAGTVTDCSMCADAALPCVFCSMTSSAVVGACVRSGSDVQCSDHRPSGYTTCSCNTAADCPLASQVCHQSTDPPSKTCRTCGESPSNGEVCGGGGTCKCADGGTCNSPLACL
jgi:hypothetical protein